MRVAIADADLVVGEPRHGEVLSEVPGLQVVATQVGLPEVVRLGLVHHDGALFATVAGEVALAVAVDVEAAHHDGSPDRALPYSGVDGLAPPLHVLGHADIHRYKPAHCVSSDPLVFLRLRPAVRRRQPPAAYWDD